MTYDPIHIEYGQAKLVLDGAIVTGSIDSVVEATVQSPSGSTSLTYPDVHFDDETTITVEMTQVTDGNDASTGSEYTIALIRSGVDVSGNYDSSLVSDVEDHVEIGVAETDFVEGDTFNLTLPDEAGTYRIAIAGGSDQQNATNANNVNEGGTSSEYHLDTDRTEVEGGTSSLDFGTSQPENVQVGWIARTAVVDSLSADITDQGYTDNPVASVALDSSTTDGAGVLDPQSVKLAIDETGAADRFKVSSSSIDSSGNGTFTYNVDTGVPQSITDIDLEVGVNDTLGESSTPTDQHPGLLTNAGSVAPGDVINLSTSQLAWTVFDQGGHFTNATTPDTTGDIAEVVRNPHSNTNNRIAHNVLIRSIAFNASTTAPAGTTLYNRDEEVNMDLEFDDAFGQAIDPDSTTFDVHDSNHNVEGSAGSQSSGPYNITYTTASDDEATFDTTGKDKHVEVQYGHYGSNDPTFDYTQASDYPSSDFPFQVSSKLLIENATNDRGVTTDHELYNRGETVDITVDVFYARGTVYENNDGSSRTGITSRVQDGAPDTSNPFSSQTDSTPDDGDAEEDEQTSLQTAGGGSGTIETSGGGDYTYDIATGDNATFDTTGQDKHLRIIHNGNSSDDSLAEWTVSRKLLIGTSGNDRSVTTDNEIYNRNETVDLTISLFFARGDSYTSKQDLTSEVHDGSPLASGNDASGDSHTIEDTQTVDTDGTGTVVADGGGDYTYTIANDDAATHDQTGQDKHIRIEHLGNDTDDSLADWTVSRFWGISEGTTAGDGTIFTGKSSSPTSDEITSRNRGQTIFFDGHIFNVRDELLGSITVNFNCRPIGSETMDEANQTLSLSSGEFTGSGASIDHSTDATVSDMALVVASDSTSSSNQPRSGTGGTGNFAETDTSSGV